MSFQSRLDAIIGQALKDCDMATPQNPLSAECHRLIDAIRRRARESSAPTISDPGGEDIAIDR